MYLVHSLILGVLANSKVPLLSSNTIHFIDLLNLGISITIPSSLKRWMISMTSLKAIERAMYSASVVKKAILDYKASSGVHRSKAVGCWFIEATNKVSIYKYF